MSRRGRPHKIDPEEQVRRAMHVFWRKGYYDTSVGDLVARAGLNRYSVCAAHGGKKALFEKTLALYETEVTSAFLAVLDAEDTALPAIRAFFAQFITFLDHPASAHGCLLCNTSSELAPDDRRIARRIDRYLSRLAEGLRRAARSAQARGELRSELDVDEFVDYCVGSVLGIMSFARSPAPRRAVRNYVHGILRTIEDAASPGGALIEPKSIALKEHA